MPIGQENIVDLGKGKDDDKAKPPPRKSSTSRTSSEREDRDLRSRLVSLFDRIADSAEARGDVELAEVIREDRDVMATGLVSLTRPLMALRAPLVILLSIVEPFMAFSRLVRLMVGRILMRREAREEEPPMGVPGAA